MTRTRLMLFTTLRVIEDAAGISYIGLFAEIDWYSYSITILGVRQSMRTPGI